MVSGLKLKIGFICVATVTLIATVLYFYDKTKDDYLSFDLNEDIDNTPTLVTQMKEIGQWEFLAISDEELIDTIRRGFFSNDELVRIYYGTLRLGIDFTLCDESWITREVDSIRVTLPPVQLLDENFLDEARTTSFMESGKWSNADRQALADRARQAMRHRCLTKENLDLAQRNAEQQIDAFIRSVQSAH